MSRPARWLDDDSPCARCTQTDVPHRGRGLCHNCYEWLSRNGGLDDYPRAFRTRDEVLQEYQFMRDVGIGIQEMPARLGMTFSALEGVLYRARRAGDPRAATFSGMGRSRPRAA